MTDIEIAKSAKLKNIAEIAKKIGLYEDDLEYYGKYKAKISAAQPKSDNLILVTAINPTPMGEGKTTTSIGLADGLSKIGKKVCLALREPSLGPVFGIKGGAAGGGYAQIVPMEDINLHFTGDLHAITAANNLIAAMLDNHLHQGNELNIDARKVVWKRCLDANDRALRSIICGLGGVMGGVPREDGFTITAASEIMAVLCLASDLADLKRRLKAITVAYTYDDKPITVEQLGAGDAAAILLKDALKPNLVQTLEGTPAIVHGGPFANIAHGCNSVIATKTALSHADYVVTESGFGADLGAEKFFDIKCRQANLKPKAVVIVATVRALKYNGGASKTNLIANDVETLKKGLPNLEGHIKNIKEVFGCNALVAINKFVTDSDAEIKEIELLCQKYDIQAVICEAWEKGGEGAIELANAVVELCEKPANLNFAYDVNQTIVQKITDVAQKVYGAKSVSFSTAALAAIAKIENNNNDKLPVCIAKTQYSFSDNAKLLARPTGFEFHISDVVLRSGAEFIVAIAGSMMLMPGLGKVPAANKMTISDSGDIDGLF